MSSEAMHEGAKGQPASRPQSKQTYWSLTWRRFRRSRVGVIGAAVIVALYLVCLVLPEFFAPYGPETKNSAYFGGPPQLVRVVDAEGGFHWPPFVYGTERRVDPRTMQRIFSEDTDVRIPVGIFVRGEPYRLFGFIPGDIHLFGALDGSHVHLLGTDRVGRDVLSRSIHAGRLSLSMGLVGVTISLVLGAILGTIAGYYGGMVDNALMRTTEVLMSFPSLPLWMTLAAAVPPDWPPTAVYIGITSILALIAWGSLAREVRGKVLSLREDEYILAARVLGASERRIILRHLLPGCLSHLIVVATLAVPAMIIAETALGFLGLGVKPPMVSWGVLLNEAQNIRSLAHTPWLLFPAIPVIVTILAFNFAGDGMRDAADPYSEN
jgi:peptide/nickel transport system permease protein